VDSKTRDACKSSTCGAVTAAALAAILFGTSAGSAVAVSALPSVLGHGEVDVLDVTEEAAIGHVYAKDADEVRKILKSS
jgi:hypothetical protein